MATKSREDVAQHAGAEQAQQAVADQAHQQGGAIGQRPQATRQQAGWLLRVVSRTAQFRRAGRVFNAEPTLIPFDELTEDEARALMNEPMLVAVPVQPHTLPPNPVPITAT